MNLPQNTVCAPGAKGSCSKIKETEYASTWIALLTQVRREQAVRSNSLSHKGEVNDEFRNDNEHSLESTLGYGWVPDMYPLIDRALDSDTHLAEPGGVMCSCRERGWLDVLIALATFRTLVRLYLRRFLLSSI